MTEYAQPWLQLLSRYKPGTSRKQAEIALDILRKVHIALYRGDSDVVLDPDAAKNLHRLLEQGTTLSDQKARTRIINQGLRIGAKELGWKINALPRDIPLKLEPSPFNPDTFALLKPVRQLEEAFLADLAIPLDTNCRASRLYGQLLLSAILFGGLLHGEWVESWFRGVPKGIRLEANCLWIEMRRRVFAGVPEESQKKEEARSTTIGRRWCADPITEALLYRALPIISNDNELPHDVPDSDRRRVAPRAWGYLRGYLLHLGFGQTELVKSLSRLIAGIKVRLGLTVSQALVGYATGDIKSVSLPSPAWTRLISGKSIGTATETETGYSAIRLGAPLKIPKRISGRTPDMAVQEAIIKELREALYNPPVKGKERKFRAKPREALKAISQVIQERNDVMCPVLSLVSAWLEHLLAPSATRLSLGRRGKALQPSSVGRYLSAIGSVLVATELEKEPAEMSQDEISEMYEVAAESKKSLEERGNALKAMARFHNFLVAGFGLPAVTFTNLPGKGPVEACVDANLITSQSFRQAIQVLGFQRDDLSRSREISILLAILGFRCGLREGEARFLLVSDLQGNIDVELLIRQNKLFRPKSGSGTRRLPLTILLEEDELHRLLAWRVKRLQEGASPQDPMFTESASSSDVISYSETIVPIRDALRQVTGDDTIVYHHLRHSAASWLLIMLVLPLDSSLWRQFGFLQGPEYDLGRLKSLRRGLLGYEDASRKSLYAVALLLGHSAPEVTLQNYVHLLDWLLWLELSDRQNAVQLTEKALLAITGLSRSQIWQIRKSLDETTWNVNFHLPTLRRQWATRLTDPLLRGAKDPDITVFADNPFSGKENQADPSVPDWRVVQRIIDTCQRYPHRILEQAETYGFKVNHIKAWLAEALAIGGIKTVYGVNRHRGREEWTRAQLNPEENDQPRAAASPIVRFPIPPRLRADLRMVERILKRYQNADQPARAMLDSGVDFILGHFSQSKRGIRCYRICQARRYLEFLNLLDVPTGYLRVGILPPIGQDVPEASDLILPWANALHLNLDQFRALGKRAHGRREIGSVIIQVAGTEETFLLSAKAALKKIEQLYRAQDSYGFRYALYMIAIVRAAERLAVD